MVDPTINQTPGIMNHVGPMENMSFGFSLSVEARGSVWSLDWCCEF